jgi:hypothetical protein
MTPGKSFRQKAKMLDTSTWRQTLCSSNERHPSAALAEALLAFMISFAMQCPCAERHVVDVATDKPSRPERNDPINTG